MVVLDIQNIAEKGISDYVNKFLKASMLWQKIKGLD